MSRAPRSLLAAVVALDVLARSALAQGVDATWERLAGPLDPPPAVGHQVLHDPLRHRLLLIDSGTMDVLWVMSLPTSGPTAWQRIPIPGPVPSFRLLFGATYDPRHDRVLIFGGRHYDPTSGGGIDTNDVWALTLSPSPAWSEVAVQGDPPSARSNCIFTYDPVRDRVLLFGGTVFPDQFPADTWSLDLAGSPTWHQLSPVGNRSPMGREGAAGVYDPWNDRMVMFGGWTSGSPEGSIHDDLWSLALAGATRWDTLPVSPRPPARQNFTAVVDPIHGELVVANGDGWQNYDPLSDAWALNLIGIRSWRQIAVSGEVPTVGGQCGIFSPERNSIIEYGGDWDPNQTLCHELSLADANWSLLSPPGPDPMPTRRAEPTLIADPAADRLLLFGGIAEGCPDDLWSFSLGDGSAWTQLPTTGTAPNCAASNFVFDPARRRLLAFGRFAIAYDGQSLDQLWAMSLDEPLVWTQLNPVGPLPPARSDFSLLYDPRRDRILMFGGRIFRSRADGTGESQDDLWELSLGDSLRWRRLAPVGTPGARAGHATAYDFARDRMIVFQGEHSVAYSQYVDEDLDDAWALSLAGDSLVWRRLGPDAPAHGVLALDPGRDRLVLWPGDDSAWALSLADMSAWRPLAIDGEVPTRRSGSGFVFDPTRDRLFVAGGYQDHPVEQYGAYTADLYSLRFAGAAGTQVAVRDSRVTPSKVELFWSGLTPSQPVAVVRADGDGPFVMKASLTANAGGEVDFNDAAVVPGRHYRYALSLDAGARRLGETPVDVPFAPAFALAGAYPNPAVRDLSLAFSLLDASPARLDVFDLAGRRITGRDVGAMGAGRHLLPLGRFTPGVYVVRLTEGARSATIRAAVVR